MKSHFFPQSEEQSESRPLLCSLSGLLAETLCPGEIPRRPSSSTGNMETQRVPPWHLQLYGPWWPWCDRGPHAAVIVPDGVKQLRSKIQSCLLWAN